MKCSTAAGEQSQGSNKRLGWKKRCASQHDQHATHGVIGASKAAAEGGLVVAHAALRYCTLFGGDFA
jgi:hypothetical protein